MPTSFERWTMPLPWSWVCEYQPDSAVKPAEELCVPQMAYQTVTDRG